MCSDLAFILSDDMDSKVFYEMTGKVDAYLKEIGFGEPVKTNNAPRKGKEFAGDRIGMIYVPVEKSEINQAITAVTDYYEKFPHRFHLAVVDDTPPRFFDDKIYDQCVKITTGAAKIISKHYKDYVDFVWHRPGHMDINRIDNTLHEMIKISESKKEIIRKNKAVTVL